ncbi:stress responsive a b barrel domain containing protein [Grosmannia clavigera kw1407]|uniref:Stress responsive a b barrel domain containing protein n=1 Tax=Grosmannia clavigera (strain kw1407 / UAMH 11150) TaxID=655863 RepID=F0XSM9_GROCL|nr:stress responsive a b barrel domain containing protein [Grosmannia clavigera kw1407]EFW99149.1 stress responsive a b barrel domain containing protein [Grosmannia clavigera kw1407]
MLVSTPSTMTLVHTVLFQFKEDSQPEAVKKACEHFLSLKDSCIYPTTNKPYILSLKGGKDNSPEGMQNGLTHGFVATFASAEDRDYYVSKDPVHLAFSKSVGDILAKVTVVDFLDGIY